MTTINPTGAGNGSLINRDSQTLGTTLNRISKALTIRDGKGADSVQISASASNAAGAASNANLHALLADLEEIVAEAARDNAGAEVRAEAQRRIDEAAGVISKIAGSGSVAEVGGRLEGANPFAISNVHEGVSLIRAQSNLAPRERLDVELLVAQSAQRGGMYLSLGSINIDLGTGSSFVFEIGGGVGSRTLSFASGTAIVDIAAAINTFTDVTGAIATVSATGIRIESSKMGQDELVTLRIIDAGSLVASADGIHRLKADNSNEAEFLVWRTYATASFTIADSGQDMVGTVNGHSFTSSGPSINYVMSPGGEVLFRNISVNTSDTSKPLIPIGTPFNAFTIIGGAQTGVDGPIDDVPLSGSSPLSPFTSSGQQAGDFVSALGAIRTLQDQLGAPITDDFLADIRRDLLKSVGKSLGVDPASQQQRSLDLLGGSTT